MKRIGKHLSCVAMVAVCALSAYTARGELVAVGDGYEGNSWTQAWILPDGVSGMNKIEVFSLSGPLFEGPGLGFAQYSGWASTFPASGYSSVYAVGTGGPVGSHPLDSLNFTITWDSVPTAFDLVGYITEGDQSTSFAVTATYADGDWQVVQSTTSPDDWERMRHTASVPNEHNNIPEPASAGLLVLGLLGLLGRRRRAQAA